MCPKIFNVLEPQNYKNLLSSDFNFFLKYGQLFLKYLNSYTPGFHLQIIIFLKCAVHTGRFAFWVARK